MLADAFGLDKTLPHDLPARPGVRRNDALRGLVECPGIGDSFSHVEQHLQV